MNRGEKVAQKLKSVIGFVFRPIIFIAAEQFDVKL